VQIERAVCHASLAWADLAGANLTQADLTGANLAGTRLDPCNVPNGDIEGFETFRSRNGVLWVRGYRTRNSPYLDGPNYEDGRNYFAPAFSVCSETACHPGLYLCPTVEGARRYRGDFTLDEPEIIEIIAPAHCVHRVGGKWRAQEFFVMGGVNDG